MLNFYKNMLYIYIIAFLMCLIAYNILNEKFFEIKAFLINLSVWLLIIFLNRIFPINKYFYYFIQLFSFFLIICKYFSHIKSDEINDKNVCIIFYKPKKIKQFLLSIFGLSYSSAGLVINKHIYQMRYEAETLQEIPFKENTGEYLKEKYLIIDTGFKYNDLKGDWKGELLYQSARQKKTLNLRFNCLRSLRFVLNQIPKYKYHGEILPCIYLLRIKIAKLIKGIKKIND